MFEGSEKKEETESSNPRWWRQERKRESKRERQSKSYMQLELLQVYKHLVMSFVAQLIDAVAMHILNLHSKDACGLMARQQNNQQHPVITFCFAVEQHAWVTCKQQLLQSWEKKLLCSEKEGSCVFFHFIKETLPSLKLESLTLVSSLKIMFQDLSNTHRNSTYFNISLYKNRKEEVPALWTSPLHMRIRNKGTGINQQLK